MRSRTTIAPARVAWALWLILSFVTAGAVAAPVQDGPYVTRSDDGTWVAQWVEGDDAAPRVRSQPARVGQELPIPAVGSLPAFKVKLRAPAAIAPNEVALRAGTPLFVMADTHGELEIAVALLEAQKIIDPSLRWSFGKGHLVVLGDVFDRGPNHTGILWLLYKLEAEAAAAGGGLHFVLGNHESMALGGDERYLHPKYLKVRDALKARNYAALWNEHTLLGQWLRAKAAVMKIGDYLCLHGGISPETLRRELSLAELNTAVRSSIGTSTPDGFAMSPEGPLWYRGYFADAARRAGSQPATPGEVDGILKFYGVKAVLVGHTIVPTVAALYGGRVVAVQVYPHRASDGAPAMEALLIRGGQFSRARIDGGTEPLAP